MDNGFVLRCEMCSGIPRGRLFNDVFLITAGEKVL